MVRTLAIAIALLFYAAPALRAARLVGRLPSGATLDLVLTLPLRNREALTNLLEQLSDPAGARHRHYLTPLQFAEKFAPTEKDYQTVAAFAQAQGFQIMATHPNRTLLDVRATAKSIERVFHLRMQVYQHPTEARFFFAPDTSPSWGAELPLLAVDGLDNFFLPRPSGIHQTPSTALFTGSGTNGEFLGGDFRAAYAAGTVLDGSGQTVGLFELDGYYTNDVLQYESAAGLPNVPLTNVVLDNFNSDTPGRGEPEVVLDIAMASCMAPGLSRIIVYEGTTPADILNRMATDDLAEQLSSSWNFSPLNATTAQIYQQFIAQGQTVFQASGDDAAYTDAIPASVESPYVTCVGGTTLTTSGPGGAWVSETAWNLNSTGKGTNASGGGISTDWAIPIWQQGIDMSANAGSSTMRNIPDVAMVAEGVFLVDKNGASVVVGGTSVGAPLWAGLAALANQQAAAAGQPPIGFLNPSIYALARSQGDGAPEIFHDITTGNNTNTFESANFFATPGYDLCTGWGTPIGGSLINALAQSENLGLTLLNGGFESGSFVDWTLEPSESALVIGTNSRTYRVFVHTGTYGAFLGQTGSLAYLSQTLASVAGQPYLVSFWLNNPNGGGSNEFLVSWNGATLYDQTNLPQFGWTNLQFLVQASAGGSILQFGFREDQNPGQSSVAGFGLDDVGAQAVPLPILQNITPTNAGYNITWTAFEGLSYQLQYSSDLSSGVWSNIGPAITATSGIVTAFDPSPSDAARFYRIMMLP